MYGMNLSICVIFRAIILILYYLCIKEFTDIIPAMPFKISWFEHILLYVTLTYIKGLNASSDNLRGSLKYI